MDTGQPRAAAVSRILDVVEVITAFLPDWLEIPALALTALVVAVVGVRALRSRLAARRADRSVRPAPGTDGLSGADYLGAYAPRPFPRPATPSPRAPGGADSPGARAPRPGGS
ncbi:hypothetical protein [Streptomyces sp. NPDC014894]|uniref:hypothetical protein n=1 Tax=unclassified Streptomyces TaxID=2593676 RepID=UPI0037003BFC